MNWDAIGAMGEVVGAAGVIFSLVYLSTQIRSQNRESRAATIQAFSDQQISLVSELLDHAAIWDKVLKGEEPRDDEEARKAILLYNMVMIENENTYFQYKSGYLDETPWKGRLENIKSLVSLPIFPQWRESMGARGRNQELLEIIDEARKAVE